jgi:hypothetical protein
MDIILFTILSVIVLWLAAIAVISERPRARLARGMLASLGVVAGAWASMASASMREAGDASLLVSLLRVLC